MSNITGKGRSVAIVGGGIVGSCLARLLSERGNEVTLIEQGGGGEGGTDRLPGSTGIAPGFVGQLHTVDALRILAQRTVAYYKTIPGAFATVGGMEVACSQAGLDDLDKRLALARRTGVAARFLTAEGAITLEPRLLRPAHPNGAGACLVRCCTQTTVRLMRVSLCGMSKNKHASMAHVCCMPVFAPWCLDRSQQRTM